MAYWHTPLFFFFRTFSALSGSQPSSPVFFLCSQINAIIWVATMALDLGCIIFSEGETSVTRINLAMVGISVRTMPPNFYLLATRNFSYLFINFQLNALKLMSSPSTSSQPLPITVNVIYCLCDRLQAPNSCWLQVMPECQASFLPFRPTKQNFDNR